MIWNILKRLMGIVAIFVGVVLLGWYLYNQLYPTAEFREGYKGLYQLVFPILSVWYGFRWLLNLGPGIDHRQDVDYKNPIFIAALAQARRTLPDLIERLKPHADNFYIKFPIVTDAEVTEHIWGYVHHYEDGVFNVSLANVPHTQKAPIDQRRNVPEDQVEDWQIFHADGKVEGSWLTVALFQSIEAKGEAFTGKMRKQRALLMQADYPLTPLSTVRLSEGS